MSGYAPISALGGVAGERDEKREAVAPGVAGMLCTVIGTQMKIKRAEWTEGTLNRRRLLRKLGRFPEAVRAYDPVVCLKVERVEGSGRQLPGLILTGVDSCWIDRVDSIAAWTMRVMQIEGLKPVKQGSIHARRMETQACEAVVVRKKEGVKNASISEKKVHEATETMGLGCLPVTGLKHSQRGDEGGDSESPHWVVELEQ
ncbi:hypothetical protein B0H13DRAFT_1870436 [Mycena leptocephala]|nr:hypothetical protein B0H13DRAFT_1870436 [Mycena leptocephala]